MLKSTICAGFFLAATAMGANAATFSYDYEVTSPSFGIRSIVGDFSTDVSGSVTSLTGKVRDQGASYDITNLLSGTYQPAGQVFDVAFQIGSPNYELKSSGSSAALTAEISSVGTITIEAVSAVPLPASARLFGAGLLMLAAFGYRLGRSRPATI